MQFYTTEETGAIVREHRPLGLQDIGRHGHRDDVTASCRLHKETPPNCRRRSPVFVREPGEVSIFAGFFNLMGGY